MRKFLKRFISFFICLVALFLPYKLRILYSEALGRMLNFFYKVYIGTINYIIKEVSKGE